MNIKEIMKKKNIKLTSARSTLLEILKNAEKPISYEDIKDHISMDKATFYRNISRFEKEGILNAFESNHKKRYYELKLNPHAHFVCISCNSIECIGDLNIELKEYEVDSIVVNGRCKNCSIKPNF
jgi:Fur family ferric uptake transcriptional regulator